ncbi:unnamed protein product [Blepharisma stoltei]|uniref:Anoctamin transmembrane domain-containing protein n=1 Tax=Blepharisma stoltei TaxID=1481888 RepID=A0AAU9ICT3_9CILI|nr:unnamed protein product [Blepharisma stoltei]
MESELIKLKNQKARLMRQSILNQQAYEALLDEKNNLIDKIVDMENQIPEDFETEPDILVEEEDQLEKPKTIENDMLKNSLLYHGTVILTRVTALQRYFQGFFGSHSSPSHPINFVSVQNWEYVIVLPNPDFPTFLGRSITLFQAEKLFKKCFNPEYSQNMETLRNNQLVELSAYKKCLDLIPDVGKDKQFKYGGRIKKTQFNAFMDLGGPPKDVLTLIRNVLLVKLGIHLGLYTRQVISENGKYIYLLIYAHENELLKEAEAIEFNLQLEIGVTDLASLEPCDKSYRPYRVLTCPSDIKMLLKGLDEDYSEIMNSFRFNESEGQEYEPNGVTSQDWESYKMYLFQLRQGLDELKEVQLPFNQRMMYYQKLIRNCMDNVNASRFDKFKLKNLWDRLKLPKPIGAYCDYKQKIDPVTDEDKYSNLWRRHKIDQNERRSIFRNTDRLKLLQSLISRQVKLQYLQRKGAIIAHFPLTNKWELNGKENLANMTDDLNMNTIFSQVSIGYLNERKKHAQGLANIWKGDFFGRRIPLGKIRGYFGEKIGLYFAFLGFYSNALKIPGIIGLVVFIFQRSYPDDSNFVTVLNAFYCIFIATWATCLLEYWRRKENCLAIKWGQMDYEEDEVPRSQFRGETRRSPIDDDLEEVFFPAGKRRLYLMLTYFTSLLFILLVLGIVAGIIVLRWTLTDYLLYSGYDFAGPVCSVLNAFQVQIFNFIYGKLAIKLNDRENHRTQSSYENSLIIKTYTFQFINSFNSLFYIAFLKTSMEGCIVDDSNGKKVRKVGANCMGELYTQLISLFIVAFLKNAVELGWPYVQYRMKKNEFYLGEEERKKLLSLVSADEFGALRDEIDIQIQKPAYITREVDGTLGDYMELAVLFGYITLFAVAFPLSCSLSLLMCLCELQVDKYKLLYLVRRPQPMGARGIGTWWAIFNINCVIAIFTNVALLCFTMPTFDDWQVASDNIYATFAVFSICLIVFRSFLQKAIPDIPEKYLYVFKRHQNIEDRHLRGWEYSKGKVAGQMESGIDPKIYCTVKPENIIVS